ncbi:hypothetical protein CCS79_09085 [Clostridium diolis]|uniref:hypothetical protein n=1 Tax=Clostridium diolis TaxID=223919 RepID=UPI000B407029|nr:hypothetical protein [Clostridium diolis]OVE69068.1 hypothetical protein CCS79_09085 [Clostridium diolis]
MNLKKYINDRLRDRNILEKETSEIQLATTVQREDKEIEYYEYHDEKYIYDEYIYINDIDIENYGAKLIDDDEYLEKNINGSRINIDVNIKNDIRNFNPKVNFYGDYDGIYEDAEVLDYQRFMVQIKVEGVKNSNIIFTEYRDSLGKLLDCLIDLDNDEVIKAFGNAYLALDLLIKKIKNTKSITPIKIKEYLVEIGFDEKKAEKIRILRNKTIIHPTEYGFQDQEPDLEIKVEKCLKHTINAYFEVFDNK